MANHTYLSEAGVALPPGNWIPNKWGVLRYELTPVTDLIVHGTDRGYYQHRHYQIPQCDECREAHAAEYRRRHNVVRVRPLAVCGARAGYIKHLRNKELPCEECTTAAREYEKARYARRKAARKEAA